ETVREGFTSVTGLRFYANAPKAEVDRKVTDWFENANIEAIASLYDATMGQAREQFPTTGPYDLLKATADVVPGKIPS
ncbi:hypothetical protein NL529_34060, partial [Klebsiella pneumoniae]|nr:hypothetical protein [Klebsiella pneumoniae]